MHFKARRAEPPFTQKEKNSFVTQCFSVFFRKVLDANLYSPLWTSSFQIEYCWLIALLKIITTLFQSDCYLCLANASTRLSHPGCFKSNLFMYLKHFPVMLQDNLTAACTNWWSSILCCLSLSSEPSEITAAQGSFPCVMYPKMCHDLFTPPLFVHFHEFKTLLISHLTPQTP